MNDIVTRLNRILSGADERGLDETECLAMRDAATEIERLRSERDELSLSYQVVYLDRKSAFAERDRARLERDEARREVCELRCNPPERFIGLPHELAEINGWDCYKENT